jgi:hypothetical protein
VSADFTISCWFKTNSISADSYIVCLDGSSAGVQAFIRNSDKYLRIDADGSNILSISTNYNDNLWHHLILKRSSTTLYCRVDNVDKGSGSVTATSYSKLYFGGRSAGSNCFKGYIDELGLWTRALTDAECGDLLGYAGVTTNVKNGYYIHTGIPFPSTSTSMGTNCLVIWHLDEGTGTSTTADSSGNNNTGTLNNIEAGDWSGTYVTGCGGETPTTAKRLGHQFVTDVIAAGDTIKMPKTPDPTDTGVNGTWTAPPKGVSKNIASSTNATPIVVTINSHGYSSGDVVHIRSHTTNTSANGIWKVTKVNDNSFSLDGSVGIATGGTTGGCEKISSCCVVASTAINKTVWRGDRAWNAGTNVTIAQYTTSSNGQSWSITANASVTAAQKLAHFQLDSTQDCSGYDQFTAYIYQNKATLLAAGTLEVRLCSDTAGAVMVDTFSIPALKTSVWHKIKVNKGSACGSNIASVAVYCTANFASGAAIISSVTLSKALGAVNELTLQSLIGQSSDIISKVYPVRAIVDDIIVMGTALSEQSLTTSLAQYDSANYTGALYVRQPTELDMQTASYAMGYYTTNGTVANNIRVLGGWNTSSGLQDGMSFYTLSTGGITGPIANRPYYEFEKLGFSGATTGMNSNSSGTNAWIHDCIFVGNGTNISLGAISMTVEDCYGNNGTNGVVVGIDSRIISDDIVCDFSACAGNAIYAYQTRGLYVSGNLNLNCGASATAIGLQLYLFSLAYFDGDISAEYSLGQAFYFNAVNEVIVTGTVNANYPWIGTLANGNGSTIRFSSFVEIASLSTIGYTEAGQTYSFGGYGLSIDEGNCHVIVHNGTSSGWYRGDVLTLNSNLTLRDYTLGSSSEVVLGLASQPYSLNLMLENYDGTEGVHKIITEGGQFNSDTTGANIHGTNTWSWKVSPTDSVATTQYFPMALMPDMVYCEAGVEKTIGCWIKRSNTALNMSLVVNKGQLGGMTVDYSDSASGSADTWEELEVTFTPSETGFVEYQVEVYGGTTYNGWIDDISIDGAVTKNSVSKGKPYQIKPIGASYVFG